MHRARAVRRGLRRAGARGRPRRLPWVISQCAAALPGAHAGAVRGSGADAAVRWTIRACDRLNV